MRGVFARPQLDSNREFWLPVHRGKFAGFFAAKSGAGLKS
jgi:hypothetical protein